MPVPQRHHGHDWLRITVFVPAPWLVNARESVTALIVPLALMTLRRLALLFAVSDFASAKLFGKSGNVRAFLASRNAR